VTITALDLGPSNVRRHMQPDTISARALIAGQIASVSRVLPHSANSL
jgi:hypothetical protein